MLRIYLIGVLIYTISVGLAFWRLGRWLDQEYRESEEFKERIDTFTELGRDWFADMDARVKMRLVLMGVCPIVHWVAAFVYFGLAASPDGMDWLIREAIDKILN